MKTQSPPQTSPTAIALPVSVTTSPDTCGHFLADAAGERIVMRDELETVAHRVNNYESLLRVAQHVEGLWNGELYYSNNSIRAIVDMAIKAVREAAATSPSSVALAKEGQRKV